MVTVNVHEAKTNLSRLLAQSRGRGGRRNRPQRQAGGAVGGVQAKGEEATRRSQRKVGSSR